MICSSLLILLVNLSISLQNLVELSNSTEQILCRHCGKEVSASDSILFKPSPDFLSAFNDTLYSKNDVFVQILSKDKLFLFKFPIITSSNSTCIAKGEWEDDLWFPEYLWKPCYCECGTLVGFVFQQKLKSIEDPEVFYGLILTQLVGENYRFPVDIPIKLFINMDSDGLSADEKEFLAKCEEEFKDRYTESDEEYMKVFNRDPPTPPVLENWLSSNSSGRRHDRRHNNRHHPYDRYGNRDRRGRGDYNRQGRSHYDNRGYNDYRNNVGYRNSRY